MRMKERLSDMRYREVIHVSTGERIGYVSDAVLDLQTGRVAELIVPGRARFFGLLGREDDYILPWDSIRHLGRDIVLIDGKDCIRRGRKGR